MAQNNNRISFQKLIAQIFFWVLLVLSLALFTLWRIDNIRAERLRMMVLDRIAPNVEWVLTPISAFSRIISDFQSYERIYAQNQDLRHELQKMRSWREAAIQLEQENARLLDLNHVKLSPRLSYISGQVLIDSGSRFRQTALINLGRKNKIYEGWAVMDGLGVVGRIIALGENSARVLFVTDNNSRLPVLIKPSNQPAIMTGDNTRNPRLLFIENKEQIRPGDRIVTSGDGGVLPAGLLVGQVQQDADGTLRATLAANFDSLEFMRVVRYHPTETLPIPRPVVPASRQQGSAQ